VAHKPASPVIANRQDNLAQVYFGGSMYLSDGWICDGHNAFKKHFKLLDWLAIATRWLPLPFYQFLNLQHGLLSSALPLKERSWRTSA
jgi:hypothetical protein